MRRTRSFENEELNVFQAFTDLMSNAFMILSFFLILALFHVNNLNRRLQSATPIVIDEKSGNFTFVSKSAALTPQLRQYILTSVIPTIQNTVKNHDIDFVQIIGHTDGAEISSVGNLDNKIETVANGRENVKVLSPGSNTDLGLMRALAVVQEIQKTGQLPDVKFRAYSAGQLYLPSGKLAQIDRTDNDSRRRIEIRFIPPGRKSALTESP
ncbi:MAG: hypothetical protein N5P05_003071 [Chroococcopsis gigantea SAG 12.99]|jgi:flagellar motor protein MotB|nr:hypothetical protein [Chlorogloea purpurea SAG 13.99]MDV3001465.1 hypothetical protein [Chroococcopsis gigantea SAG 12.99]